MSKFVDFILILAGISVIFFNVTYLKAEVKNEDIPLKGEWDFNLQKMWELDSAGDDIIVQIADIHVDQQGRIYILEWKHHKFFVFDGGGKFLYSFGKKGEGPGEYKAAFSFFLEGKYVIVPDQTKVLYYTKEGKFVKSYTCRAMLFPRIFLDEYRLIRVQEGKEGTRKFETLDIWDLTTMKHRTVAEISSEKVLTASGGGQPMRFKDPTTTPMVIVGQFKGELYFGKNDEYVIKKTDPEGKELLSFSLHGRDRKKIPIEFKRKRFENVRLNNKKMPGEMIDQMVKGMPDHCTYFNQIVIDGKGLIYIHVNDAVNLTGQEIDIFSPGGKYLFHSHIKLPAGLKRVSPFIMKRSSLLVFAVNEDGEQKLFKFKIKNPSLEGV